MRIWNPPTTAPTDGTVIEGRFLGETIAVVRWGGRWDVVEPTGAYWGNEDMEGWRSLSPPPPCPVPLAPTAKRRTELHVIDHNGDEHMLAVWHSGDLRAVLQPDALAVYEREDRRDRCDRAVFLAPQSYAVLLHEDPLGPELVGLCTTFAREVAHGLGAEPYTVADIVALEKERSAAMRAMLGRTKDEVERIAEEASEAQGQLQDRLNRQEQVIESQGAEIGRLKRELEQMREAYKYPRQHAAAEARRILDSPVTLEPGGFTFVSFKYAKSPSILSHDSYTVNHDDEMMTAWRIVAFLTRELSKLAEGGAP